VTDGKIPGTVVQQILDAGKAMIEHPVELLPGVAETLEQLAAEHPLLLITKGELFHQESKVARSGLAERFTGIEIVSEKDPETYRRLLERYSIDPERFVMVGNSVKSDILPVVAIGGNAIHIPYESQWVLDRIDHRGAEAEGFFEAPTIRDVPRVLQEIAEQGWATGGDRAEGS
ncbi:MAG: HAD family hydrolase, partial [Acidobacteriota bacterium]